MINTNIWKNRRLRQIILLVGGSIIILWLVIVVLFYNFKVSQHEQFTLMRLTGIANSLSLQIDGDVHEKIFVSHKEKDGIENSKDSRTFLPIGDIARDGTSNETKHYEYIHT